MLFNMRRNGKKEFTDSEKRLTNEIIENCFPLDITQKELDQILQFQFKCKNLKPILDGTEWLKPTEPPPRLDIVILPLRIGIRVNGLIHKGFKQKMKDEDQKFVLEGNGWTIIDVNFDDREDLWEKGN